MTQTNDLIARIEQAFADVAYPGDDDLTDSSYGEEPAAPIEDFRGKTDWRALDSGFLDQAPDGWASALSFFSGRALRFYLPAYLIADLRGELMSADPVSRLCSSVTPQLESKKIAKAWGGGTMGDHARAAFALYDAAQVSVIVEYLWWRRETTDGYDLLIDQALESYWLERDESG
jgi:hypothetical protein